MATDKLNGLDKSQLVNFQSISFSFYTGYKKLLKIKIVVEDVQQWLKFIGFFYFSERSIIQRHEILPIFSLSFNNWAFTETKKLNEL